MQFIRYFLFLIFLSITIIALPQAFHGGVTAGIVGSQVAGDNFSGYHKGGIFGGGWVSLDMSERTALKMELTYFQKGSRENPTEKNGYKQFLLRLNYVEMPLLFQYKIKKLIIEAGPSMGFLMGSYVKADEGEYDFSNDPKSLTIQINLGMEYILTQKINVGIRTNDSLWNIFTQQTGVWRFWDYGWFNDSIVIYATYRFK